MSEELFESIAKVGQDYEADIIFYCGPVFRPKDDLLIDLCKAKKQRKNALLIIATFGGNPDAAYRITRTLQYHYCTDLGHGVGKGRLLAFVDSVCASAGTLIAMGADELILSDHAELGPIDMQLKKTDEVGERISGLTSMQALEYLEELSRTMFSNQFRAARFDPKMSFPTTTASKVATDLTVGLLSHLYEQIDPIKVAENFRFLNIAEQYARRIQRNLQPDALSKLVRSYPSHEFVIDAGEARTLFQNVSEPKQSLADLAKLLKDQLEANLYSDSANVCYLEVPPESVPAVKPLETHESNGSTPYATPQVPRIIEQPPIGAETN